MAESSTLSLSLSLSLKQASILQRVKEGYLLRLEIVPHIRKTGRYTIGIRIENKFLDLLEQTHTAYFTDKNGKAPKIDECIFTLDILKFIITVAWDGRLMADSHFEKVVLKLDEIGRMLGGWKKSLDNPEKKNRTL